VGRFRVKSTITGLPATPRTGSEQVAIVPGLRRPAPHSRLLRFRASKLRRTSSKEGRRLSMTDTFYRIYRATKVSRVDDVNLKLFFRFY
jgi:hypothetical protein